MIKVHGRKSEIKNYQTAFAFLEGRQRRKLVNNTWLEVRDGETIAVRYHKTDVVTYKADGKIILNSGGWQTVTTKERLNAFSPLGVYQRRGVWLVSRYLGDGVHDEIALFKDGATFEYLGDGLKMRVCDPALSL